MIIQGLMHIDAAILGHDEAMIGFYADGEVEEERFARSANNPPFHPTSKAGGGPRIAMKLQRMGHPVLFQL
jgi:hypothetical protein